MDHWFYRRAPISSLITAAQKDDQYQRYLLEKVHSVYQNLFGLRDWMKRVKEITMSSNFAYYSMTSLSGLQTLGEEASDLIQVDQDGNHIPSFKKRLTMVFLETSLIYAVEKLINRSIRILENPNIKLWPAMLNEQESRLHLMEILPKFKYIFSFISQAHLIVCYFFGSYYNLSKRLLSIKYINLTKRESREQIFKIIGTLHLIQLIMSLVYKYYSTIDQLSITKETQMLCSNVDSDVTNNEVNKVEAKNRCSLCLAKRVDSTCTPCGHLFCWYCICEWIQVKGNCPICREKFTPSRLIYLQNYD